jgi:hypothetical protein
MQNRDPETPNLIRRKPNVSPALVWGIVVIIILTAVFFLLRKYQHDKIVRETRHAIDLAGGIVGQDIHAIQFHGQQVTDSNLWSVSGLSGTSFLEVHQTQVTDRGIRAISDWKHLRYLFLNGNPLTDDSLDIISKFELLERLELTGTQITDEGIDKLAKLKNLTQLRMDFSPQVTSVGIKRLQTALPGCQIEWSSEPWVPTRDPEN